MKLWYLLEARLRRVRRQRPSILLAGALTAALALSGASTAWAVAAPRGFPAPVPTDTSTPFPSPSPTDTGLPQPCVAPAVVTPPNDPEGASVVQGQIEDVGGRIRDLVDRNGYPGFTGLIADPDHARLLLCWLHDDPLPSPIAAIAANPGQPITVVREDTPYSYDYLASLVMTIDGNSSLATQIGGAINAVVVPEEGTGLIAEVTPDDPPTFDRAQPEAILSAAAGVPVTVQVSPAPTYSSRLNDGTPWTGGNRLNDSIVRPVCTSGFGMLIRGRPYLLTADHCGAGPFFNGLANPVRVGLRARRIPIMDSAAIELVPPVVPLRDVYTGGVNDATEGTVHIDSPGTNIRNLFVCTSGSVAGEHCAMQIVFTSLFLWNGQGPYNWAMGHGDITHGNGDSGGPVIMRQYPGLAMLAMGTITGGFFKAPCAIYDATVCANDLIYTHLKPLLRAYGGTLSQEPFI